MWAGMMVGQCGISAGDAHDLPTSEKTFPDGAHYRIEISGLERPSTFKAMTVEMIERNMPVHRAICAVMGATLLDREELKEIARMANESRTEVIITPGPRSSWDTGRQIATPEGALSGLRVRGADNLSYLLADVKRSFDAGIRGFLVTDEGVLWMLNKIRNLGALPGTVFKISIYAGHANPAGAKVLEILGANTFNPVADLSLAQLAAIRQTVKIPIDVHVMLADSFGGFNRMWEAAEIVRVCSPCYLKIEPGTACAAVGGMYKPWTDEKALANLAVEKVKYASIINDLIQRTNPGLKMSEPGPADLAIPVV